MASLAAELVEYRTTEDRPEAIDACPSRVGSCSADADVAVDPIGSK